MNRLDSFAISALFCLLTISAPPAVWAQGDPSDVPDMAVHEGPNTVVDPEGDFVGEFLGNFIVFGDGSAQGTVMLRGLKGLHMWDVFAAEIVCDGLSAPQVESITLHTDLRHSDMGPPTLTPDIKIVVETTDLPACLIWDIADGNVHDGAVHTDSAHIQIFNDDLCAAR